MKRFLILTLMMALAIGAWAQLTITGSTGATTYTNVANTVGNIDADQDLVLSYAPFSLALNVGYTHPWLQGVDSVTFGYTLSASQAFGAFTLGGSIASNALTQTVDGAAMTGDWLGDIKLDAAWKATDQLSIASYTLLSAKQDYPVFMAEDIGAVYNPFAWLSLTVGGSYMDALAVTDDVGYKTGIAAVEGLAFYAKAKISY